MSFPIPRNVGATDRVIRVVAGVAAASGPLVLHASWPVVAVVGLLGAGTALSGLLGRCSVYHALGVSTRDPG